MSALNFYKMSRLIVAIPLAFFMFLFSSCEQNADVELPEVPPKLVLVGFITPQDTAVSVRVSKSRPVFQSSNVNVNESVVDATVTIYGNSTSIQLPYVFSMEMYSVPIAQFPIIPGNEYRIEVSAPGMETVTATTTVPGNPPADFTASMTYTIDSSNIYNWMYSASLSTSFTDFPAEGDYYRLVGKSVVIDQFASDTMRWNAGTEFIIDANGGSGLVSRSRNYEFGMSSPSSGGPTLYALDVYLMHCSEEYYEFHRALADYSGGDDPFSEPTLMYTNVTGGFGVFAGATYSNVRLHF
jgi:hypothetical protein